MISCKDFREPDSGSQRYIMKLVLERTNQELGSMGVGAGVRCRPKKSTFAISSPDEFLLYSNTGDAANIEERKTWTQSEF